MRAILELSQRVAALERHVAGMMRHGKVAEVDTAAGWVRMDLGPATDGGVLLSPKVPYAQIAGALKVHSPPSVGQQMTLVAPGGDFRQAVALPMTWSDENVSPGSEPHPALTYGEARADLSETVLTINIGPATVTMDGGEGVIRIECGSSSITLTDDGIALNGARIDLN